MQTFLVWLVHVTEHCIFKRRSMFFTFPVSGGFNVLAGHYSGHYSSKALGIIIRKRTQEMITISRLKPKHNAMERQSVKKSFHHGKKHGKTANLTKNADR